MKVDFKSSPNNNLKLQQPIQRTRWRGNHFICLNGRLYAGPKFYAGLITLLYIISYAWVFTYYILMRLNIDVDGFWFVELLLLILTAFFCLVVIFRNPGASNT
jgi:hypothetical protein